MTYLTLGSCLKGEETYIEDFIHYHRKVGVEKFVFFDRAYDPLKSLLTPDKYPDVEIVGFPENQRNVHAQCWADAINMMRHKTFWLALIDADQALVPVKTNDVKEVLRDYEKFASLQINWLSFGSGGQEKRLPGSVYERFTKCTRRQEGVNNHTQFICQPLRVLAEKTHDPHHPRLPATEMSVNTNKNRVDGPFNIPPLHDVMYVAHYINKSKEEFLYKNSKGRADIFGAKMPLTIFDDFERISNVEDDYRVLELWKK